MAKEDIYISIEHDATAEITEKKSRFIANVHHAQTEEEAMQFVEKIKKEHYSARHNVYAFVLNSGFKKYTDDGEPSKTAGLPILEMLEKEGITDVVCVVTRYFGGTLLGTGGLVRAYTESAKLGVQSAGIVKMDACELFEISCPYNLLGSLEHLMKTYDATIEEKNFTDSVSMAVTVASDKASHFLMALTNEFNGGVVIMSKGKVYRKL